MIEPADNPYAPPTPIATESKPPQPTNGSRPISICSAIGTVAFLTFTIVLLRSSPGDQKVGFAFLANGALMICFTIAVYHSTRRGTRFGIAATIIQTTIMCVLLPMQGTDTFAILLISMSVIAPLVALTVWSWLLSVDRQSQSPGEIRQRDY
jgi:hypothetical protein